MGEQESWSEFRCDDCHSNADDPPIAFSAAARVNPSVFARQHSELRRKQRLHRSNAGRRFANPGSEHLQHSAQESPNYSCRQVAARHHNYRRRSGFAVEANDAQLHGPFPWNKIAGVQLTRNRPAQGTSRFLRRTLQSVLFILQKVVEFLNQLHEFLMVLFLCDPLTQDMHAFSFVRGHGASRSDCAGNYSIADASQTAASTVTEEIRFNRRSEDLRRWPVKSENNRLGSQNEPHARESKKVAIAFPRDGSHRDIDSSPTLSVAPSFRG